MPTVDALDLLSDGGGDLDDQGGDADAPVVFHNAAALPANETTTVVSGWLVIVQAQVIGVSEGVAAIRTVVTRRPPPTSAPCEWCSTIDKAKELANSGSEVTVTEVTVPTPVDDDHLRQVVRDELRRVLNEELPRLLAAAPTPRPRPAKLLLSVSAAARLLGVSRDATIHELIATKRLRTVKVKGRLRVSLAELERVQREGL